MNKRILVFLIIALMLISTASAGFFSELFTGNLGELITGKTTDDITGMVASDGQIIKVAWSDADGTFIATKGRVHKSTRSDRWQFWNGLLDRSDIEIEILLGYGAVYAGSLEVTKSSTGEIEGKQIRAMYEITDKNLIKGRGHIILYNAIGILNHLYKKVNGQWKKYEAVDPYTYCIIEGRNVKCTLTKEFDALAYTESGRTIPENTILKVGGYGNIGWLMDRGTQQKKDNDHIFIAENNELSVVLQSADFPDSNDRRTLEITKSTTQTVGGKQAKLYYEINNFNILQTGKTAKINFFRIQESDYENTYKKIGTKSWEKWDAGTTNKCYRSSGGVYLWCEVSNEFKALAVITPSTPVPDLSAEEIGLLSDNLGTPVLEGGWYSATNSWGASSGHYELSRADDNKYIFSTHDEKNLRFQLYGSRIDDKTLKVLKFQNTNNIKIDGKTATAVYKLTDFSIIEPSITSPNTKVQLYSKFNPENFYVCNWQGYCVKANNEADEYTQCVQAGKTFFTYYKTECYLNNYVPKYFVVTEQITPQEEELNIPDNAVIAGYFDGTENKNAKGQVVNVHGGDFVDFYNPTTSNWNYRIKINKDEGLNYQKNNAIILTRDEYLTPSIANIGFDKDQNKRYVLLDYKITDKSLAKSFFWLSAETPDDRKDYTYACYAGECKRIIGGVKSTTYSEFPGNIDCWFETNNWLNTYISCYAKVKFEIKILGDIVPAGTQQPAGTGTPFSWEGVPAGIIQPIGTGTPASAWGGAPAGIIQPIGTTGTQTTAQCLGCQVPTTDNTGTCMQLGQRITNEEVADYLVTQGLIDTADLDEDYKYPAYCGLTTTGPDWLPQKTGNEICDNPYECESLQCLAGTCVDISSVQRERTFVRKLFCKLATWGPISYKGWETEEQCHSYLDRACESDDECSQWGTNWVCHTEDEYCVACQYHSDCSQGEVCFGDGCTPCQSSSFCYRYFAELDNENLPAGWETRWNTDENEDWSNYIYCQIPSGQAQGVCTDSCTTNTQCEDLYAFGYAEGEFCDTTTGICKNTEIAPLPGGLVGGRGIAGALI